MAPLLATGTVLAVGPQQKKRCGNQEINECRMCSKAPQALVKSAPDYLNIIGGICKKTERKGSGRCDSVNFGGKVKLNWW